MARISKRAVETSGRLAALGALTKELGDWRPAATVIRRIEAVPTIFPKYDEVVGIGGNPVGRIILVHGPSGDGKSGFCLGLGRSYLERGHIFALADAERTASLEWLKVFANDVVEHPGFIALPVDTYEQVRAQVRLLCDKVAAQRDKGNLPADTTGLIVVDSIRKLVPEQMWKNLTKELGKPDGDDKPKRFRGGSKKAGLDGFGGRGGQIKAAMNAMWVDELIPLLANTRMSIAIIAREHEEEAEGFFSQSTIKVGGGDALNYDASLRVRVVRDYEYLGEGPERKMIGEKHTLEIRKTKMGTKKAAIPRAYFHTSNGAISPVGFDMVADIFEMGRERGLITTSGSFYKFDGATLAAGKHQAMTKLRGSDELRAALEREVRKSRAADLETGELTT